MPLTVEDRLEHQRSYIGATKNSYWTPRTGSAWITVTGGGFHFPTSTWGERTIDLCYSVYEASLFCAQPHTDPDHLRGAIVLPAINDGVLRIVELGPAYMT